MTERQGGSDVRANFMRAEPSGDGDALWREVGSARRRRPGPGGGAAPPVSAEGAA